jgi:hypothetical protein
MLTSQDELISWLMLDTRNIDRCLKSLDRVYKGKMVLILDRQGETIITAYHANKKNKRFRR